MVFMIIKSEIFKKITTFITVCSLLLLAAGAAMASNRAIVDITVNGANPKEYGQFEPYAYLFKKDSSGYTAAGKKFRISDSGRVEADIPEEASGQVLQIYLPGGLTPVFSNPLKPGEQVWKINAAEISIRSQGKSATDKEVFLFKKEGERYTNLWKKAKAIPASGHYLLPLPDGATVYAAGVKEKEIFAYSDPLKKGVQTWNIDENRAPYLTDIPDQTVEEGARVAIPLKAVDPDNDTVVISVREPADFITAKDWNDGTGVIIAEPLSGDAGAYRLEATVFDGKATGKKGFNLLVKKGPVQASRQAITTGTNRGNSVTAVWANDGLDKVTREELRSSKALNVANSVWDGSRVSIFGARNEVVSFNIILEAAETDAKNLTVSFNKLSGPKGSVISSRPVKKEDVFNYIGRNIELFYVGYLQIKGLSRAGYEPTYDERHVPVKLRLPYKMNGNKAVSSGLFSDRPNAYRHYPDIAIPMEAVPSFGIKKGENQSIWIDIYIPENSASGVYNGNLKIFESGKEIKDVPVKLEVFPFALPDSPSAKTMLYFSEEDINDRYMGKKWIDWSKESKGRIDLKKRVWDAHHLTAHRHKISLIDDGVAPPEGIERWKPVLSGSLFTRPNGYDGPGVGMSSGVYSIGTYGAWRNVVDSEDKKALQDYSDTWANWFNENFPKVEYFLYLMDEPKQSDFPKVQKWASWIREGNGSGRQLKTLVTKDLVSIDRHMPSVDIGFTMWGDSSVWKPVIEQYRRKGKEYWAYNGMRIASGSFLTEDEGVSLEVLAWTQFKHKVARWFYWQSTHYRNTSHVSVETNVFRQAWTFGRKELSSHPKYGETGPGYMNGDGVLFYPGIDRRFPQDSYGLPGPMASLRMKHWRRGIQDVDYLTLASRSNPAAVNALVQKMIPKVLWEVGVTDPKDPSYVHIDIGWPVSSDEWSKARRLAVDIIMKGR